MALVGKAGAGSDFSQPRPLFPNKLDRTLQSEMHDVAMRCHADGSGKYPREMEWAAPCNIRERLDPDRLIEMSDAVVPEPPEQSLPSMPRDRAGSAVVWAATNPSTKLLATS